MFVETVPFGYLSLKVSGQASEVAFPTDALRHHSHLELNHLILAVTETKEIDSFGWTLDGRGYRYQATRVAYSATDPMRTDAESFRRRQSCYTQTMEQAAVEQKS